MYVAWNSITLQSKFDNIGLLTNDDTLTVGGE